MTSLNTPINKLFVTSLSAITKTRIISFHDFQALEKEHAAKVAEAGGDVEAVPPLNIAPIDLLTLLSTQLMAGPVYSDQPIPTPPDPNKPPCPPGCTMLLTLKSLSGQKLYIGCDEYNRVGEIKRAIFNMSGLPIAEQKLIFSGKILTDSLTLSDYNIVNESIVMVARETPRPHLYLPENIRDPHFDYDHSASVNFQVTFKKGIYFHRVPCGWRRFALNVTNLYLVQDEGRTSWFGGGRGKGEDMEEGEWPVAYVGTGLDKGRSAAQDGFRFCKEEPRKRPPRPIRRAGRAPIVPPVTTIWAHGVYTTPDIVIAENHGSKFTWEGDNYKAVLQVRVNPDPARLKIYPTFRPSTVEYWISQNESDIRPWGILVKKV